jgi:hypothetical protein
MLDEDAFLAAITTLDEVEIILPDRVELIPTAKPEKRPQTVV